jgi:hypothetical protein
MQAAVTRGRHGRNRDWDQSIRKVGAMRLNDDTELSFRCHPPNPLRLHTPMAFAPLLRQVSIAGITL